MRFFCLLIISALLPLGLSAHGVVYGFSRAGGHFVIGGAYRHSQYGAMNYHRDPYAYSRQHNYAYYGHKHHRGGYGKSCGRKKEHSHHHSHYKRKKSFSTFP